MKITTAVKKSLSVYKKNFGALFLALLVEAVLRCIALCPLLFLADKALAPLAWLTVPAYLLIALPARQNYALALQAMLHGGSVFSLQLLSVKDYGVKLWRGVKGLMKILLWSVPAIAGVGGLYAGFMGAVDFFTFMAFFKDLGGSVADGVVKALMIVGGASLLTLLGCAVHSGARHAFAMADRKALKGHRTGLVLMWVLGALLFAPYIAVAVYALNDFLRNVVTSLKALDLDGLTLALNMKQQALLLGGAVLLVLPALPLRSLFPAVYLSKELCDAQA